MLNCLIKLSPSKTISSYRVLFYIVLFDEKSRVSLNSVLVIFLKMVIWFLLNIIIGLIIIIINIIIIIIVIIIIIIIIKSENSRPACSY